MNKPTPEGIAVFHKYVKSRENPSPNYNRYQAYTELLKFIDVNIKSYDSAIMSVFVMLIALSEHKATDDKQLEKFCATIIPSLAELLNTMTVLHTIRVVSDIQPPNTSDPIDPNKN